VRARLADADLEFALLVDDQGRPKGWLSERGLNGERVRRNKTVAEIEGIDQRTGELDYSTAFTWDGDADDFVSSGSEVLDEIRDDNGWSQSELLDELRDRQRFLQYLQDNDVTDYRRFTAMVNEYYAHKDEVMERIEAEISGADGGVGIVETD
jgi:flagellar protein FlaI